MSASEIFARCAQAIEEGILIHRESKRDKEYHFQDWFQNRLDDMQVDYDEPGRNSYPDFRLVNEPDGYEIKGLAYPGRDRNYDSNSRLPKGIHNGRNLYYVFGRYPKEPDGNSYPVLDFVMCHGSFLNADNDYIHCNKSFNHFGSYGDIKVRDRKMYVVPTPFALASGIAHQRTLILPADIQLDETRFTRVGELQRIEIPTRITAYSFDLQANEISTTTSPNPNAGAVHAFTAWRLSGSPGCNVPVTMVGGV